MTRWPPGRPLAAALLLVSSAAHAGSVELPIEVGGAFRVPAVSLFEAKYSATIRQQYDFSCGSAALSTLLTHHYGHPVTEAAVFQTMFINGDQEKIRVEGFSLLDIKRYLESLGYLADGFEAGLDALVKASVPAIVLINENGYMHFVVVKGLRDGRVLFGDPAGGTRAMSRDKFEAMWANGILFVITNRQARARFNHAQDWAATPRAPLASAVYREGLYNVVMPKLGPSDF